MNIKELITTNIESINTVVINSTSDTIESFKEVFRGNVEDIPQELLRKQPYVMTIRFCAHEATFQFKEILS